MCVKNVSEKSQSTNFSMTHFLMGKASRRTEKLSGVEGIDVMACRTVFSCPEIYCVTSMRAEGL